MNCLTCNELYATGGEDWREEYDRTAKQPLYGYCSTACFENREKEPYGPPNWSDPHPDLTVEDIRSMSDFKTSEVSQEEQDQMRKRISDLQINVKKDVRKRELRKELKRLIKECEDGYVGVLWVEKTCETLKEYLEL